MVCDITDRKRAEERLRENEARLHALFEGAQDGILLADIETKRFVDANPAICEMLGYTRKELVGIGVANIYPKLDLAQVMETFERQERGELDVAQNLPVLSKDGSLFTAEISVSKLMLSGRQYTAGFFRDVTERQHAQEALRRHRQHLEDLVALRSYELKNPHQLLVNTQFAMDRAGIGIHWVTVETGQLLYANRYAAERLGYGVEEMLALRVPDIDPNFPPGDFKTNSDKLFAGGTANFESLQKAKDGTLIPVEVVGYMLPVKENQSGRSITFIMNISRRKETERSLIEAREAAEAASVSKRSFLANMSHEIRTPLNAITGMVQLIRRSGATQEQSEPLDRIDIAGQHLLEIINAILDLSKIEAASLSWRKIRSIWGVSQLMSNQCLPNVPRPRDCNCSWRKHVYDLILMDMQMPKMDGLEATRRIRQMPNEDKVPILVMTATAFAEDKVRCFNAGKSDFISPNRSSRKSALPPC